MSKNTFFNTRFWQDAYVSDLDPSEKLLFVYCITSPMLSLTGIYEVPLKHIALDTGIDRDMVMKILTRFEEDGKIIYRNGWLCVVNYPKYQSFKGEKLVIALEKEIKAIPNDILDFFIKNKYPIDTLSIPSMDRERDKERELDKEREEKYSKEFLSFWEKYPKKVGKGEAAKVWKKVRPPLDVVLSAVEGQSQSTQWQKESGQFIPNPATWLNQSRWEDELIEVKSKYSKYDD